jgi:hypothetical protein
MAKRVGGKVVLDANGHPVMIPQPSPINTTSFQDLYRRAQSAGAVAP